MEKILIVSKTPKSIEQLSSILSKCSCSAFGGVSTCEAAKQAIEETEYDIVLINAPLADDSGLHLAAFAREKGLGVILLVNGSVMDKVQSATEDLGAFLVEKPLNPPLLIQGVRFVSAAQKQLVSLREENMKLSQKVEDLKIIDRAKCCLMQYLNMSEKAAHRYIEKQAMDTRSDKRRIAERILKTYEY